jgi:hypothetical protein
MADASINANPIGGNTRATSMRIGERAADSSPLTIRRHRRIGLTLGATHIAQTSPHGPRHGPSFADSGRLLVGRAGLEPATKGL